MSQKDAYVNRKNITSNSESLEMIVRYLPSTEKKFLELLYYMSSNPKKYGILDNGMVWICNTYEQWGRYLKMSKISVIRATKSLKERGFIFSEHLSPNRRNRTLYYRINFEAIRNFFTSRITSHVLTPMNQHTNDVTTPQNTDDNMYDNMYYIDNINNKSNKSNIAKNLEKHLENNIETLTHSKTTTVQDMIKIWKKEFPSNTILLTKQLAKFLVAAFKTKFSEDLQKWKRYLKLLKTSPFVMGEKFRLNIWWVIKFFTIDRINAGELGVDSSKIRADSSEIEERLEKHLREMTSIETPECLSFRQKLVKILSPSFYLCWLANTSIREQKDYFVIQASNTFMRDYIIQNVLRRIDSSTSSKMVVTMA